VAEALAVAKEILNQRAESIASGKLVFQWLMKSLGLLMCSPAILTGPLYWYLADSVLLFEMGK
jgi:hypothetical protein